MPLKKIKKLGERLFKGRSSSKAPVPSTDRKRQERPLASSSTPSGADADRAPVAKSRRRRAAPRSGAGAAQTRAAPKAAEPGWTPEMYPVEPQEGMVRFQDLGLEHALLHGVAELGFRYCTPVQAQCLPLTLQGRNVAGRAQTGTGKTAAFLLSTLQRLLTHPRDAGDSSGRPRALVLGPTRELVMQIEKDAAQLARFTDIRTMAVYGGMDFDQQREALRRPGLELVAATPGRLLDFLRRGEINLRQVEVLIIDEADRMLDMGFIPDVRQIIRATPAKHQRQTMLFSATLTGDVMRLAEQWMPEPTVIEVEPEKMTVDTVEPVVYMVSSDQKFCLLYNLLTKRIPGRVLIFSNRRDATQRIAERLQDHGMDAELLSGAVDQKKRMRILEKFKDGRLRVVVATDVAGRGLHVDDIDYVINFDLPYEPEDYVHRIGRTGRAGKKGIAISFACEDESFIIPDIEAYIGDTLSCRHPEDELLAEVPPATHKRLRSPQSATGGGRGRGRRDGRGGRPRQRPGGVRSKYRR